jgi:hypothetical protein
MYDRGGRVFSNSANRQGAKRVLRGFLSLQSTQGGIRFIGEQITFPGSKQPLHFLDAASIYKRQYRFDYRIGNILEI